MIYWALLLHIYQPPTQSYQVLRQVYKECYIPLLEVLESNPNARITLNISGVLTEMLWEHGLGDFIDRAKGLAAAGNLELVGSGKYHPIFPLIPQDERARQIELNYSINRRLFGEAYKPRGFFLPELAYGPDVAETLLKDGFEWVLLSGIACPIAWPVDLVHHVERNGQHLKVLFRDDLRSNGISFRKANAKGFVHELRPLGQGGKEAYVVTAMDGETFGHHIKGWDKDFLEEAFRLLRSTEGEGITATTVSELVGLFPAGQAIEPLASSWSTSRADLEQGNPYPLWNAPDNEMHRLLWTHLNLCIEMTRKAQAIATTPEAQRFAHTARHYLDQALHSCQFWWASGRPMRDVNMVHRGLLLHYEVVLNAYRAIESSQLSREERREWRRQLIWTRSVQKDLEERLLGI